MFLDTLLSLLQDLKLLLPGCMGLADLRGVLTDLDPILLGQHLESEVLLGLREEEVLSDLKLVEGGLAEGAGSVLCVGLRRWDGRFRGLLLYAGVLLSVPEEVEQEITLTGLILRRGEIGVDVDSKVQ